MFWHVRMISSDGEFSQHLGWVVKNDSHENAIDAVRGLGLDIGEGGEFQRFPELVVDVLEFNSDGVAEL
jgi:hypothetical protein